MESILDYGEQTTLITETEGIGEKQAYWNARHNEKFNPETSIVFSLNNLKKDNNVINIPLYLVEYLSNIIDN